MGATVAAEVAKAANRSGSSLAERHVLLLCMKMDRAISHELFLKLNMVELGFMRQQGDLRTDRFVPEKRKITNDMDSEEARKAYMHNRSSQVAQGANNSDERWLEDLQIYEKEMGLKLDDIDERDWYSWLRRGTISDAVQAALSLYGSMDEAVADNDEETADELADVPF